MNPVYTLLSAVYILAIFLLADSGVVSRLGEFNPYSLLHIPLYGTLTLLILLSLCTGKGTYSPKRLIASGFIAGIVGAMDELYQAFIPTRDGSGGDVLLDVLGVAIALMVFRRFFPVLETKFRLRAKRD
jgi:VanZ family protein